MEEEHEELTKETLKSEGDLELLLKSSGLDFDQEEIFRFWKFLRENLGKTVTKVLITEKFFDFCQEKLPFAVIEALRKWVGLAPSQAPPQQVTSQQELVSFYPLLKQSIDCGDQYFFSSLNSKFMVLGYLNKGIDTEVILALNLLTFEIASIKIAQNSLSSLNPFKQECRILKKIEGVSGVQRLICCEFVNDKWMLVSKPVGISLDYLISSKGPFSISQVMKIAKQLASTLQILHQKYIFHRDITPYNIIQLPDQSYCLIDFGIACADDDSESWKVGRGGTPLFMSRLFHDGAYEASDDMESLAFTLIYLLNGFCIWEPQNEILYNSVLAMNKQNFFVIFQSLFLKFKNYEIDEELESLLKKVIFIEMIKK